MTLAAVFWLGLVAGWAARVLATFTLDDEARFRSTPAERAERAELAELRWRLDEIAGRKAG
jgi:hypothetical protein